MVWFDLSIINRNTNQRSTFSGSFIVVFWLIRDILDMYFELNAKLTIFNIFALISTIKPPLLQNSICFRTVFMNFKLLIGHTHNFSIVYFSFTTFIKVLSISSTRDRLSINLAFMPYLSK